MSQSVVYSSCRESAATAAAFVAAAGAVVAFAAATVVAAATAAATTRGLSLLEFFGLGVAHGDYFADIVYFILGEGMVEVEDNSFGSEIYHYAVDAIVVGGHQGDDIAGSEHVGVELAVDGHAVAGDGVDFILGVGTEGLVGVSDEVEFVAFLFAGELFLEGFDETESEAVDGAVGVVGSYLVYESFSTVGIDAEEFIGNLKIFAGSNCFHIFVCLF